MFAYPPAYRFVESECALVSRCTAARLLRGPTAGAGDRLDARQTSSWMMIALEQDHSGEPTWEHHVRAIICPPGEGATVENPLGGPLTFKVRGDQTNGALVAFESATAPGEGPPLHVHANEDEILYVLEGTLRFKLEDEVRAAPAGSFVFIPRAVRHTWQNVGDGPARLLVFFTPAGMETFFERFARLSGDVAVPEAFGTLGSQVGMDVVGPPLAQSDPL